MAHRGAAALLAGATLLHAATAAAYCRSKACDDQPAYDDVWQTEPDPPCERLFDCLIEGQPLHWPPTCISYAVQKDGSKDDGVDFALATSLIDQAFAAWQGADCGGAPPSLVVKNLGAVTCSRREYNQTQPNANVFIFRDQTWPYVTADRTIAFTTITYNTETAEIYSADVELNSHQIDFSSGDVPGPLQTDLLSVLTHEVGHFLGLGHTVDQTATMWWDYDAPETKQRTLEADDEAGICEIYPPGREVGSSCEPRHGFSRTCAAPEKGGCGLAQRGAGGAGSPAWLGAAVLGLLLRRGLSWKRRAPRR